MLKKRIVATLIIKDGIVVQSIGFKKYLPIGDIGVCIEFLNIWGIDEIILLDIDKTKQNKKPDYNLINKVSRKAFVPLTVGGGIGSIDDMRKLIRRGADKLSINSLVLKNPKIISEAAEIFGRQCIVVSIDIAKNKGKYEVFAENGNKPTGLDPVKFAKKSEELGAGEILLSSIEKDGLKKGYDLDIIKKVADSVLIPVIACGGAGNFKHFLGVFQKTNVMAAAAGNFFHFTEHSPVTLKSFLVKNGINVRLDTNANYKNSDFMKNSRVSKMPDKYLNKLRFEYIKEEII